MNEVQLDTVITVDELRSFGAAGAALRQSQSTVSRHVAEIEHDLGARLFERDAAGVRRTPAGERLIPRVIDLRQRILDLRDSAAKLTDDD